MNVVDRFLNNITMYRLVLYGLAAIVLSAFGLSALGLVGYSFVSLATSLAVMLGVGFIMHHIFVFMFRSAPSSESWLITTLILFLILKPASTLPEFSILALGIILATASKYLLNINRRHLFNPVAIALVVLGLLGSGELFWWVGSKYLFPVILVVGLLIVRKIRRFDMVIAFLVVALAVYAITRGASWESLGVLKTVILSGPLLFFATLMLTEPQTSPQKREFRILFAIVVGALYSASFELPPLYSSPELALVAGNLFAFAVSYKRKVRMELEYATPQGAGVHEFSFSPDHALRFKPGQYLEWTLPHHHTDSRGNRRYFTIASAPSEPEVKLTVRIDPEHASSFKKALLAMQPGDEIWGAQLSGDFILPRKQQTKLVFIAGGIGITPFRSMVQDMVQKNESRDTILFYAAPSADGFSYWQLFNAASKKGLRPHYVITGEHVPEGWRGLSGYLTEDIIHTHVPDYRERRFYLSGPNAMVANYRKMLLRAGVPRRHIKTDYFPGF